MVSFCKFAFITGILFSTVSEAALIYDKHGTKLNVGGMVKLIVNHAGKNSPVKGDDASVADTGRFKIAARTRLNRRVGAYSAFEWQAGHGGSSREDVRLKARTALLGVDFRKYGKIQFGRYNDPFSYASDAVSIMDDFGTYGGNNERNSGHLSYMWSGNGFDAGLSYQFAVDNYNCDTLGGRNFNVDSGFSVYGGYTFDKVLFGPLSLRTAYLYLNAQSQRDGGLSYQPYKNYKYLTLLVENLRSMDGSVGWGDRNHGFYIAANYNYTKVKFAKMKKHHRYYEWDSEASIQAVEMAASYNFESGFRVAASYHFIHQKVDNSQVITNKGYSRWMQLLVDYQITPKLKVWIEDVTDLNSDKKFTRIQDEEIHKGASNVAMIGLRYSF